jgi:hypothetical protein
MKIFNGLILVGLLLLTAMVGWLSLGHKRLNDRIAVLNAENERMTQQIAEKPSLTPDGLRDVQARLGTAQALITALEARLSNAPGLLNALNTYAVAGARIPNAAVPGQSTASVDPGSPALPPSRMLSSSSHTPEGQLQRRDWGPEQLVGPPDTFSAGDIPTAWAQRDSAGAGEEWLHVHYDQPVDVAEINVRETYNPGAISKISAVLADGKEVVLWEGVEPASQAPVDMSFSATAGVQAQSVKVYLDRTRVSGWNEIDAVELVGRDGSRQWASRATTSSAYPER